MTTTHTPGGARLMLGFHGREVTPAFESVLRDTGARGVILFARNIVDAAQTRELIADLRSRVSWPLVVAVDQEGGVVVRVAKGATVFPGNMALGAAGSPELADAQGLESGRQLAAMGFDLNLAPVVDLQTNPANPGIGVRSLGADIDRAARLAEGLVRGHDAAGVTSCLKHFPGKGAASVDAHKDLPVLDLALEQFHYPHIEIFERLFRSCPSAAVMTSHIMVTGLDSELPATLSSKATREMIRERLGCRGLILTDDLEMGAIVKHWGIPDATERSIAAGHDVVLICHEADRQRAAAERLEEALAAGRLSRAEHEDSVRRIEAISRRGATLALPDPTDGNSLAARIAQSAVHLFGDAKSLLPIRPTQRTVAIAFRPRSVVGVEEAEGGGFEAAIQAALASAGLTHVELIPLDLSETDADDFKLPDACASADRVLLFTWDARSQPRVRRWLDASCRELASRLVVLHLRNPFDQALVPPGVTALTAFGYQSVQLRALAKVLTGQASATGRMPAPLA